jgi:hypothetical protein
LILIAVAAFGGVITTVTYLGVGPSVANHFSKPLVTKKATFSACSSNQLIITGAIHDCVREFSALSCPSGSFDQARVAQLHGNTGLYILYVEVNGSYHGPGTYTLAPWPHEMLGVGDCVPKVGLRKWVGGELWYSTS